MLTLILGRTGAGKHALRSVLEKRHRWKFAENANDAHGGDADAYVTGIAEAKDIIESMPDTYFQIVYVVPPSDRLRHDMAIAGSDDPEAEARRLESGDGGGFDAFEAALADGLPVFPASSNYEVLPFSNTYEEKDIAQLADDLEKHRRFRLNAGAIVRDMMASGQMNHTPDMRPLLYTDKDEETPFSVDMLCSMFRTQTAMLGELVYRWMTLPGVRLEDIDR